MQLRPFVVVLVGLVGIAVACSALPRFRRPTLRRRLTPYLGAVGPRRSALLDGSARLSTFDAVVAPLRTALAERLDRWSGDGLDLIARLEAAGLDADASGFRGSQVTWGLGGLATGLSLGTLGVVSGRDLSAVFVAALGAVGAAIGVVVRDRLLTRQVAARREEIARALPTTVDLVCLAVTAGESLRAALALAVETCEGALGDELARALRTARGGATLVEALEARARVIDLTSFDRFVAAVVAASDRGVPIAGSLRALAFDLREQDKRELIELAGRKQVSMLVPVIALILPVAIVFAFYPGVVAIRTLAR